MEFLECSRCRLDRNKVSSHSKQLSEEDEVYTVQVAPLLHMSAPSIAVLNDSLSTNVSFFSPSIAGMILSDKNQ